MSHVTGQRFEIGDNEFDLPLFAELFQSLHARNRLPRAEQVLGNGLPVADPVVCERETPTMDLRDLEIAAQVGQTAIKRDNMHSVSRSLQVRDDFLRARRVARALAVHAVEYAGHQFLGASITRLIRIAACQLGVSIFPNLASQY